MKLVLSSLLVLSILFIGTSQAYADVTISAVSGSGAPGCEETAEGCYSPNMVKASVGEIIVFKNPDTAAHTFTSGSPEKPESIQTLFDSSLVMSGGSFEYIPESEGIIDYFCMVHPWMIGTIIVGTTGDSTTDNPVIIPPTLPKDNQLEIENLKLKDQVEDLKLKNLQLKSQVNALNSEIDSLKDQIVSMTKEFVDALEQLTKWFGQQLIQNKS